MRSSIKHEFGLVLSGGGIRGVAHIGAIKALEEINIRPTIISGTSAGAVIGALYAAGATWQEMLEFFHSTSFFSLSKLAFGRPGMFDTDKYRSDLEPFFPEDSFEALIKSLYITATDLNNGMERQFYRGSLLQALLASVAVPGVFSPVVIDGIMYADGGIVNNFPVEPLLPLCKKIVGVSVNPIGPIGNADLQSSFSVIGRAFSLDQSIAYEDKFSKLTILINPEGLTGFGMFEMNRIDEIFDIGYREAKRVLTEAGSPVNITSQPSK